MPSPCLIAKFFLLHSFARPGLPTYVFAVHQRSGWVGIWRRDKNIGWVVGGEQSDGGGVGGPTTMDGPSGMPLCHLVLYLKRLTVVLDEISEKGNGLVRSSLSV